ncbi:hypothetical protein K0P33_12775 [Pseudomonas sp. ArH3a]|uniref:DUF6896 domain-containing protein n=1 Tax=Pseudomonas sp. ArH3a TaxID=2862945 RepID=UPI001F5850FD|nr:hypothetical protein [Pseudomonas sp. ArH3a]UNM22267.1 hypothetical protein K0P33_12775 [Pseudomonas sp. ArH3a]
MNDVLFFVELQCRLFFAFAELHPNAKDLKWLLDFPQSGEMIVDGVQWRFVKHGAGLRFEKTSCEPHWVVDVHKFFGEPKRIDEWRLIKFLESCGKCVDRRKISSLLIEMCAEGHLIDHGSGQYFFVG